APIGAGFNHSRWACEEPLPPDSACAENDGYTPASATRVDETRRGDRVYGAWFAGPWRGHYHPNRRVRHGLSRSFFPLARIPMAASLIAPHGGTLVNRTTSDPAALLAKAANRMKAPVSAADLSTV